MSEAFIHVRQALDPLADPARAAQMRAYMRGQFPFLGISTPARREASQHTLRGMRNLDRSFIAACFQAEERELQYVACDHIRGVGITDPELAYFLIRTRPWWDTVDALAKPIGAGSDASTMRRWAVDEDFWVRRVAIIHQLGLGHRTDLELLSWIIQQNLGSGEFFINKAIGWALRDLARHDPSWVQDLADSTELSPLSRREALKNL